MKNTITETTRLLLQGTLTKEEADKFLLDLCSVSGSLEKDAIMHYDLLIKRDLPNTFKTLRDHGTHCDFCDKINDIRTEAILNYR